MSQVFMIGDTHAYLYPNNYQKWMETLKSYFYDFYIPLLKEKFQPGDICIHLGDLFDNRTYVTIDVLVEVEKIITEISKILPLHIIIGNHDIFTKSSGEYNLPRIFRHIPNVFVYEKTTQLEFFGKKLILMPWVEKRIDQIKIIESNKGDYLFCHSDLNGCQMHLNSVAQRNPDKINIDEFKGYIHTYSAHIHIVQNQKNFTFIGSIYQMDRNDIGNQKGVFILDVLTGREQFVPNTHSPVFKKVSVLNEDNIDSLDKLLGSKDYIDLSISNKLLVSNRKLRRKLEVLLEKGNFTSVEYIDDIVSESEEKVEESLEETKISISLDYENYIKEYILSQKYGSEEYKRGIVKEFDEIIRIYTENFKSNSSS